MSTPISSITLPKQIESVDLGQASTSGASAAAGDFQKVLQSAIQQVEDSSATADSAVKGFLSGENQELHSTILASQTAELQFQMFMQVRNKVVSAYDEVMKMQL